MPHEMDVQRLIVEVKNRPTLWDVRYAEYKDRTNTPQLWQEIADILGFDVEQCKRKWKNLRDAYRAEVRRTERRLERIQSTGQSDSKGCATSKWVYFEPMSFINETKRAKYYVTPVTTTGSEEGNSMSGDNPLYEPEFHSFCDIKMEPPHTTDDDDDANDMLFEEFKSVATPQAARRLSTSIANAVDEQAAHVAAHVAEAAAATSTSTNSCKCPKPNDDQVHFLEGLEREEQKLMQSTRRDMTRADNLGHIGDADYNFLVSFLPQMKKMSELQNLQFRARMSELLLNIMTPPALAPIVCQALASSISTTTPMLQGGNDGQCGPQQQQPQQQQAQLQLQQNQQQQQQQQQQLQMLQSELMDEEVQAGNGSVATSSSNWP